MAEAIDDSFDIEEEFTDPVHYLRREYRRRVETQGANSVAALSVKGLIISLLYDRGDYTGALKAAFDLYWRKVKVLGLTDPSTVASRFLVIDLLKDHGTAQVTRQIYPYAVKTFRILVRHVKRIYKKGLYDQALVEGVTILEDVMAFFGGEPHQVSFDLACLIAMVYAETEDYADALEIVQDVYSKRCKLKYEEHEEPDLKGMAATLMKKGSILLRMCRYKDAMDCYLGAQSIRQSLYGIFDQRTMAATLGVAEVCYNIGNFKYAKVLLRCVGKFQKKRERPEILYTYIHNGNLEFARGNYRHALAIFRKAAAVKKAPLQVRAMVFRQMGALLVAMGRYTRATRALQIALKMIWKTEFHVETLIIYRYMARVLQKLKLFTTARSVFETLIQTCEQTMSSSHSVLLTLERDLGELFFASGWHDRALGIFRRLLDSQNSIRERIRHPTTLKLKCQVAKVLTHTNQHTDALAMFDEVVPVLAGYYYPQHRDRILIDIMKGAVYQTQGYNDRAYQLYYKSYEVIVENYGIDHRYTKKIIRMMNAIKKKPVDKKKPDKKKKPVGKNRMIEATLAGSVYEILLFVAYGDDVNVRDVDGIVPLHHAAKKGYENVVKALLGKGAIYNAKDMFGNTPLSILNDNTKTEGHKTAKFLLILIGRMFECVKSNDVRKFRMIVQLQPLIINARDCRKRTLLQWAVSMYHVDIVKELIDRDADVTLSNQEDGTALHMAAESGYADIMFMLLKRYSDKHRGFVTVFVNNRENFMQATAMHIAAKNEDFRCLDVLAEFRASPLEPNIFGKFPYDLGSNAVKGYISAYTTLYFTGQAQAQ